MENSKKLQKKISNGMKIDWAPLVVPASRRFQTLAVGLYVFIFLFLPLISFFITVYYLIYLDYIGRALLMLYLAYIYFDHKRRFSAVNGIGWMFWRKNVMTDYYRDYFPIDLVKTAELSPDRNYLVASFPHGIMGTGLVTNMGINISKWLKLFPGIRPKIATLDMHFYIPFMREIARFWGFISCSKGSLLHHLNKSNDAKDKGNIDGFTSYAVAVVIGGAQEAIDSRPGNYVITLKNRKGFVKIAIRSGSAIVPSFSFGEVDIFDQVPNPPDSRLRKFQTFVKHWTGVSPLIVLGRGFFQYSFGLLPQRRPIVQVIGAPIEVMQMDAPDTAYINEIHQKVIDSLNEIFEKYKHKYIKNAEKTQLVIN